MKNSCTDSRKEPLIDKKIGQKIRQMRKGWGLSQSELAERIGISFQQVQKYEKGSTRISVMRLLQISEALGVRITAFFEEGEGIPKVSDFASKYASGATPLKPFNPSTRKKLPC